MYDIDLSEIQPIVAKPHFVDNVVPAKESLGVHIDEAFLGSCNNGRIEDLRVGASIIKGKKVHPLVRFLVVPASRAVYKQAAKEGLTLKESALKTGWVTAEQFDKAMDPAKLAGLK